MDDMLVAAEALQGLRSAGLAHQHHHRHYHQRPCAQQESRRDTVPSPSLVHQVALAPVPSVSAHPTDTCASTDSMADTMEVDPCLPCDGIPAPNVPHLEQQPTLELQASSETGTGNQSLSLAQPQFLTRVSSLPIVETGIRSISSLYESTKSSSKVVQYSASVLESNLRPLSKYLQHNPMVLEVDDFACRQLDRFTAAVVEPSANPSSNPQTGPLPRLPELDESLPPPPPSRYDPSSVIADQSHSQIALMSQASASNVSPRPASMEPEPPRYRSRWQQVTAGAVAAAGAGAAVLSEESMKSLRYCLEWLQYAANQLNHHMQSIQSWLSAFVSERAVTLVNDSRQIITFPSLAAIKRDIADTLRRVVDVVGRYAGSFLRGDARSRVRMFILSLPSRWADLQAATDGRGSDSVEAERVLAFASEADDILTSIRGLFEQSLSTAEQWVGTLGRVPFVSTLVPQHAQYAFASIGTESPVHHHAGGLGQGDGMPTSPTVGLANMSLASPAPAVNGCPQPHLLLPGAFDGPAVNHGVNGRKRRTVEDEGFPSDNLHCGVSAPGVTGSHTAAAQCVEHGEAFARDLSNTYTDGSPPMSLKKRKKGKQH